MSNERLSLTFLGTGNAWGLPNELCMCTIDDALKQSNDPKDKRLRTSLYIEVGETKVVVDCGPDFRQQRIRHNITNIDALLITHTHQDHIGGLDELHSYWWASTSWKPISTYIHKDALSYLKNKKDLGFVFGSDKLLNEIIVESGESYRINDVSIIPFKTFHGNFAPGSLGYIIDAYDRRIIYTSDFGYVEKDEEKIVEKQIDVLIIEANWFNEPEKNPWGHMSFQNSIEYIKKWNPEKIYFVHLGNEDQFPGDLMNNLPTKWKPKNPLPYPVPRTHEEWVKSARAAFIDIPELKKYSNPVENIIAYDGFKITFEKQEEHSDSGASWRDSTDSNHWREG